MEFLILEHQVHKVQMLVLLVGIQALPVFWLNPQVPQHLEKDHHYSFITSFEDNYLFHGQICKDHPLNRIPSHHNPCIVAFWLLVYNLLKQYYILSPCNVNIFYLQPPHPW